MCSAGRQVVIHRPGQGAENSRGPQDQHQGTHSNLPRLEGSKVAISSLRTLHAAHWPRISPVTPSKKVSFRSQSDQSHHSWLWPLLFQYCVQGVVEPLRGQRGNYERGSWISWSISRYVPENGKVCTAYSLSCTCVAVGCMIVPSSLRTLQLNVKGYPCPSAWQVRRTPITGTSMDRYLGSFR